VSAAGDVNGDGIDDLVVGAFQANSEAGESYVVFGSTQGFPAIFPFASLYPDGGGDGSRGFVLTGVDPGDSAGRSVSAAGDVNADGIDDLIIGAPYANDSWRGESYVVFGSARHFPAVVLLESLYPAAGGDGSRGFVLPTLNTGALLAQSVSAAGDVNGDGIDDVIIGANGANPGGGRFNAGESYVVFGSTQGFPAVIPLPSSYLDGSRGFVLTGVDLNDASGDSVSAAGDVNSDGIDDIIVGAATADVRTAFDAGESYVVFGSIGGFPAVFPLASLYPARGGDGSRGFVLAGIDLRDLSGDAVSGAGDVNGDGIADLIIGATGADPGGETVAGETYVVFGRAAAP
jgi:hypothetical protein